MTLYNAKDAELAARILKPEYVPQEWMSYQQDWLAYNQPPTPVSNVIGAQLYNQQVDAAGAQLTISSSAAENTAYSRDIGGEIFQTGGALRLELYGDYLSNSIAGSSTIRIKVKYGATTMWDHTSAAFAADTDRVPLRMMFILSAADGTSSQALSGEIQIASRAATPTSGLGPFDNAGSVYPVSGTASENSKLTKTFAVTLQHSRSDSNVSYRRNFAVLTKIAHTVGGGDVAFAKRSVSGT